MQRNFTTGTSGLVAIDKLANEVLFLDPVTYEMTKSISGFAPNVHELLVSEDHTRAYVPIYGDGIHGKNPDPGHLIAVIDLLEQRHLGDFSVDPYRAPHGMRCGSDGQLYCVCENSGVVLEIQAQTGAIEQVLSLESTKAHRIEITPDGSKLYAETEEDGYLAILDLRSRSLTKKLNLPHELDGLGISPDGTIVLAVDAEDPQIYVIKTSEDVLHSTIQLEHHRKAAQIVRYSPDGRFIVVTSHDQGIGTILNASLRDQRKIHLEKGPMDMAFHPDGETVLIANQDAGSVSVVNLNTAEIVKTLKVGRGIETLSFF